MPSWTLPPIDCSDKLAEYLEALPLEEVAFVVLFGSVARGQGGELDILIGLRRDGEQRFVERLRDYSGLGPGVRALPYYPKELDFMTKQLHLVLLDASDHGLILFDRGPWKGIASQLKGLKDEGKLERIGGGGWRVRDYDAGED